MRSQAHIDRAPTTIVARRVGLRCRSPHLRPARLQFVLPLALLLLAGGSARGERIPLTVPLEVRGYERINVKDGIVVYKHRTAEIIQVGAEGRFAAPPEVVAAAALDYHRQVKAIARLSESQILARGAQWLRVYQRLNLPIIDDRDFTLQVRWGTEGEVRWITFDALPASAAPLRRGVVRVKTHEGSWQFKPIDGGRGTFARFVTRIDMGGSLPKWLARSGSGKEMPKLFTSLNGMLQQAPSRRVAWSSK